MPCSVSRERWLSENGEILRQANLANVRDCFLEITKQNKEISTPTNEMWEDQDGTRQVMGRTLNVDMFDSKRYIVVNYKGV